AIEDIIRELKGGFAFGKTDSSSFFANKARMWISQVIMKLPHGTTSQARILKNSIFLGRLLQL
ncbi:MAG: hypothetical protein KH410_09810, partial [Weissella confusa]|nr:hypothetical protein [Weissella confusa]